MRTLRRLSLTLSLSLAVGLGAVPATVATAAADPVVTVTPSTDLFDGVVVGITASGLPPSADIAVNLCNQFDGYDSDGFNCPDLATTASDAEGRVDTAVALPNLVFVSPPFGDALPVYCRADVCRIFLTWTDADGVVRSVASDPLEFAGSPATIEANRTAHLPKHARVKVSGTAYGAERGTVVIVEEACYAIIQGSGCNDTTALGAATIASDGTYALEVRVSRVLEQGNLVIDCGDPHHFGNCQLTARIFDAAGQADYSFGYSPIGDPGVRLAFHA